MKMFEHFHFSKIFFANVDFENRKFSIFSVFLKILRKSSKVGTKNFLWIFWIWHFFTKYRKFSIEKKCQTKNSFLTEKVFWWGDSCSKLVHRLLTSWTCFSNKNRHHCAMWPTNKSGICPGAQISCPSAPLTTERT